MESWRKEVEKIKKPKLVIGFTGKAGCGKDTVAKYIQKKHNLTRVAFADTLKEKVMIDFDLTPDHVYGKLKEVVIPKYNKSPREIMQLVGSEWYRSIYQDYWIECLLKKIKNKDICTRYGITISDVRFPNEIEFIRKLGGIVVLIERDNLEEIEHNTHVSETAWNDCKFDTTIYNSSTEDNFVLNGDMLVKDYEIIKEKSRVAVGG